MADDGTVTTGNDNGGASAMMASPPAARQHAASGYHDTLDQYATSDEEYSFCGITAAADAECETHALLSSRDTSSHSPARCSREARARRSFAIVHAIFENTSAAFQIYPLVERCDSHNLLALFGFAAGASMPALVGASLMAAVRVSGDRPSCINPARAARAWVATSAVSLALGFIGLAMVLVALVMLPDQVFHYVDSCASSPPAAAAYVGEIEATGIDMSTSTATDAQYSDSGDYYDYGKSDEAAERAYDSVLLAGLLWWIICMGLRVTAIVLGTTFLNGRAAHYVVV